MIGLLFSRRFGLLLVFLAGSSPLFGKPHRSMDLTDTVLANRITTRFAIVIRGSGLASFLSSRGPFTLFVPVDSAFSRLPPGELEALLLPQNQDTLQRILLFHLVNGNRYSAKDLLTKKTLPSCEPAPLTIRTSHSGAQFVQKAKILRADVRCENGLIHEIDTVLIPPDVTLPPPVSADTPASTPPAPNPVESTSTNAPPEAESTNAASTNAIPVALPATNNP